MQVRAVAGSDTTPSVSYAVIEPARKGSLVVEACEAARVPKGASYSDLKDGKRARSLDGDWVYSQQVRVAPASRAGNTDLSSAHAFKCSLHPGITVSVRVCAAVVSDWRFLSGGASASECSVRFTHAWQLCAMRCIQHEQSSCKQCRQLKACTARKDSSACSSCWRSNVTML